jgi:hypothetical protein
MDIFKRLNIPIELSFTIDSDSKGTSAYQDPSIPNRYWFNFPAEIHTSTATERLIGFRSFWISRSKRELFLGFSFYKPSGTRWSDDDMWKEFDNLDSYQIVVFSILDITDDWSKLYNDIQKYLSETMSEENVNSSLILRLRERHTKFSDDSVQKGKYWATWDTKFSDEEEDSERKAFTLTFCLGSAFASSVKFNIQILNNVEIFNASDYPDLPKATRGVDFYDVWDRHSNFLTSDLSTSTTGSYLGYSLVRYNPLKYYRLNGNFSKFYIELYNGHHHTLPSIIPADNKDHITVEMVLLQDAPSLYT